jgi:D-serine deaminase-like pyridoxal phosphate-dependent protein
VREARSLEQLITPAAIVDVTTMAANLDAMAAYTVAHRLDLWPHTKTHKTPELARDQLQRGARGVTVATLREAETMASVADQVLIAYPPVGAPKLARLAALASQTRLTVALDSMEALEQLRKAAVPVRVLVEIDAGMHRVGVTLPEEAVRIAQAVSDAAHLEFAGVLFYPGHIREHVAAQTPALRETASRLQEFVAALAAAGLAPARVSGGSTPTATNSHMMKGVTEIRPGTYIFNDRTTAAVGACEWSDCAYTVLATVVSTAIHGQVAVDAGSKALSREDIRGADAPGFGALLDRPDVIVKALSEEHGLLDISQTDWRPRIGDRVRIVPNHVCVSVNLQPRLFLLEGEQIVGSYEVRARGW